MVDRIKQRKEDDCQTAVTAMLSDEWTYDELADEYGTPMEMRDIVSVLEGEGLHYNLLRCDGVFELADHAHYHDRLYVTITSPISERDPDLYWELASGERDDMFDPSVRVLHALAIRDGEVLDPKPDPYFESWHDLKNSPYEISCVSLFAEDEPRILDFTRP